MIDCRNVLNFGAQSRASNQWQFHHYSNKVLYIVPRPWGLGKVVVSVVNFTFDN